MAIIITLVGLMESIAVAKALAERNGYDLDANQELAGLPSTLCVQDAEGQLHAVAPTHCACLEGVSIRSRVAYCNSCCPRHAQHRLAQHQHCKGACR